MDSILGNETQTRDQIECEIDRYHTTKQLEGRGLEEDPEWVKKLQSILDGGGSE